VRPDSIARVTAHAEQMSSRTSSASGLLKRPTRTATGVSASISAARIAARWPSVRRTMLWSTSTDATPQSAFGSSMLKLLKPKIRADSDIIQTASGVLSMLTYWLRSTALKNIADQLRLPA
jgi:hypothetical protein